MSTANVDFSMPHRVFRLFAGVCWMLSGLALLNTLYGGTLSAVIVLFVVCGILTVVDWVWTYYGE